jgi:hypothetical protein
MDLVSFIGVSVYSQVKRLRLRLKKGLEGTQLRSGSSREENITLPGIESNSSVLYS